MTNNSTANPLETGTDEVERYALEECIKRQRIDHRVAVLVTPAGRCELAIQFARMGALVTVADTETRRRDAEGRILAAGLRDEIAFTGNPLADMPDSLPGAPFDIIVIRRGICGLRYEEARHVIRQLLRQLKIGGKLYVSILGLHSELSDAYAAAEQPVELRFAELAPAMAKKYGIKGPVCLYTERNLFMLLLDAGASVLRTLTTTYGNVKGVAVRV